METTKTGLNQSSFFQMPVLDVEQNCLTVVGLETYCKIPIMITDKYSSAISERIFQVTRTSMQKGLTI